jgi:hypothetical protein
LSAHYDVVNIESDNANDNSASIINCISYKLKNPSINLLLLDGEEPPFMGMGSFLASNYLKTRNINVKWILNLELTGLGEHFFIDNIPTILSENIIKKFGGVFCINTPPNDAMIFREEGFQSNVITTVNLNGTVPDYSILYKSHTIKDSVNKISIENMKNFVENILDKIVNE